MIYEYSPLQLSTLATPLKICILTPTYNVYKKAEPWLAFKFKLSKSCCVNDSIKNYGHYCDSSA